MDDGETLTCLSGKQSARFQPSNYVREAAPHRGPGCALTVRQLIDANEREEAQHLLHQVYIEEQGWEPAPENPSGVRIQRREGRALLLDNYADAAHWFGAFEGGRLIGCFRVLPAPYHELASYRRLPSTLRVGCELNRLAVTKRHRGGRATSLTLMQVAFDHAFKISPVVFVTAQAPSAAQLFKRLGMRSAGEEPFRYSAADPHPVELLMFDASRADRYREKLYRLAQRRDRRRIAEHSVATDPR